MITIMVGEELGILPSCHPNYYERYWQDIELCESLVLITHSLGFLKYGLPFIKKNPDKYKLVKNDKEFDGQKLIDALENNFEIR